MNRNRRFLNKPLLLEPSYAAYLLESAVAEPEKIIERSFYNIRNGVSVIPVGGVLIHGDPLWGWGESSYRDIDMAISSAMVDAEVRAIALWIDSPGGEVSSCFDLADKIFALRKVKPIYAICADMAFSAAYALASATSQISLPRSGAVGSIGVIALRLDMTQALEQAGIKVTTIQFGAQKTDTSPMTPLSDEAEARLQADVNALGAQFIDLVARNRKLGKKVLREYEAATFLGQKGVDAGLADHILTPEMALGNLIKAVS